MNKEQSPGAHSNEVVSIYFGVLTNNSFGHVYKSVVKIYQLRNGIYVYNKPSGGDWRVISPQEFEEMVSNELVTI